MTPNLLKIIWFLLPVCGLGIGLAVWPEISNFTRWSVAALASVNLLGWCYLSIRVFGFRKRLFNFLRLLLAGDYEAGIRTRQKHTDEVSRLEDLANQVADRLRTYDRLRAARVSIHSRVLDLILVHSKEGIITANVEKETFVFNPVAQKILGVTRKSFSFESVLKPSANETFTKLFNQAVSGRKVNTEGLCFLQLPGMRAPARLSFLMMPLRDRDETVRFAVLSIESSGASDS
jgi:PAS domain-containing protein